MHRSCPSVCPSVSLSVSLSVCLSPKCKKKRFSLRVIVYGIYWRPIGSHVSLTGLFKEPIIGFPQSKIAETRHLENRHDVIFFCREWSDLDKISQTGTYWHVNLRWCVEMETRCRIPIWRTFSWIRWHVIPQPRVTLQGAATWWIHCHDSRTTCHTPGCSHLTKSMSWSCHIAGCKNSIRHIENRFSPYFIYFCF